MKSAVLFLSMMLIFVPSARGLNLASEAQEHAKLSRLNIDPDKISISGLSSGKESADFAVQFFVAFSKSIKGLGVFAGQPFHCAVTRFKNDPLVKRSKSVPICEGCPENATLKYDHCKRIPGIVNVKRLVDVTRQLAQAGKIDDTSHMKHSRVYLYAGTKDPILNSTKKARDYFNYFVENIKSNFSVPSGHCWPQNTGFHNCGANKIWPVENCGYDGPGELLSHMYGPLNPPLKVIRRKSLYRFDQTSFDRESYPFLSKTGFLYLPKTCEDNTTRCSLHVSLHGCSTPHFVESILQEQASFNRWAETNNIVVLWPHVSFLLDRNATKQQRQGCWDSYGQTGKYYDTQEGLQMKAIRKMIETISGLQLRRSQIKDRNFEAIA